MIRFGRHLVAVLVLGITLGTTTAQEALDPNRLLGIDQAVTQAIDRGELPGAVVMVLHRGEVVYRKAFGLRSKEPQAVPMTTDTLFDLASLTKPVATATSLMILLEKGKLRLEDPVAQFFPAFAAHGKEKITVEQLLLHTSGLIADNPIDDYRQGREKAVECICELKPLADPGVRFIYSDVNFILLGLIVEKVSGLPLDEFSRQKIFEPLGMEDTGFRPRLRAGLSDRAAPTERIDGKWLPGEVHDPRSHLLGGVAGHAGLFSTVDDLRIFACMMLGGGVYREQRILSPGTVRLMTTPRPVPGGLRACGWDVNTSFSANRGQLFSREHGFGHTGFTGTSLWFDPESEMAVIFLSNRVHPQGKGNVTRLRGQVATIAASAVRAAPSPRSVEPVGTGLDVLVQERFARLRGRKVGLVTNHSGRDREGRSAIDLLNQAEGVTLVALFSPEHGIRGAVDEPVGDSKDEKTGLPIYSLYGQRKKPTPATLKGVDTLIFDIQDAGCRFYTYSATLGYILETAAENRLKVVVLDRPNPIGGLAVSGPVLDPGRESFVGYHRLPIRHGLTFGELALLYNAERKIGADLEVVRMEGWRRGDLFDRTGLAWVNPSPNLRNLTAELLYPGIGLLETTNLSVGRGTDRPFEWIGAPWLDGRRLAAALSRRALPGMRFIPAALTPASSKFKGEACGGVQIFVDDWSRLEPVRVGLTIAVELHQLYPQEWQLEGFMRLLGHQATWDAVKRGATIEEMEKLWQPELVGFLEKRRKYLLYAE